MFTNPLKDAAPNLAQEECWATLGGTYKAHMEEGTTNNGFTVAYVILNNIALQICEDTKGRNKCSGQLAC